MSVKKISLIKKSNKSKSKQEGSEAAAAERFQYLTMNERF